MTSGIMDLSVRESLEGGTEMAELTSSEYEHMIDKPLKFRVAQVLASGSLRIGKFDLAYEDACDIAKKLSDKKFKFIVVDSIGTPVE